MTRKQLLAKINTLDKFYVSPGVIEEIEDLRSKGWTYQKIWKHFKELDEIEF